MRRLRAGSGLHAARGPVPRPPSSVMGHIHASDSYINQFRRYVEATKMTLFLKHGDNECFLDRSASLIRETSLLALVYYQDYFLAVRCSVLKKHSFLL